MTGGVNLLRVVAPGVLAIAEAPVSPPQRHALAERIGRKAAGLSLLPAAWTPPFVVLEASVYQKWADARGPASNEIIATVADAAAQEARTWGPEWDRGITVRSSATEETLNERGTNHSVELTADYDGPMIGRAIAQVFERFRTDGSSGAMGIVVQARVAHLALGHISNEQRVSKTINQWMWEYEPADKDGGRFNSQRDDPPDPTRSLKTSGQRPNALAKTFRQVGRWCTNLGIGRTHLEWGATTEALWIFQLDFEDDQPDTGVDPTTFLRTGDFRPPGSIPSGSPFSVAPLTGDTGWPKLDKVASFVSSKEETYPTLVFVTGDRFQSSLRAGHDLAGDLESFAHGRIVCRTDCSAEGVSRLNLPRTHTVTSAQAVEFIDRTLQSFEIGGVPPEKLCFILHKFIPSVTAAWAVARPTDQIVRVDSLWGLPDGLQYLPHDSFEYDVKRKQQSSERPRYKHAFLQETDTGKWEVVRIARKATRGRSLPAPDLAEVAMRTHEIACRLDRDIQIMWFCQVPEETGLPRNIPWFSMPPAEHAATHKTVSPLKRRIQIRSMLDLDQAEALMKSKHLLQLDPDDPELFRSQAFLERVKDVAKERDFPVGLTGSILGHAFYMLEKAGVSVIALNEPTRSRARQRRVFRKLVRDDIPEQITEAGECVTLAEIAKGEMRAALITKLLEESYELLSADTPQEVTAELADMLEVVRSLAYATGVEWDEVQATADQKRTSRGSFERSVVLLETSWPGWMTGQQQAASFTVPLASLGHITESEGAFSIPYALLLAPGSRPTIKLASGSEIEIRMTASGVQLAPADDGSTTEEQIGFDF